MRSPIRRLTARAATLAIAAGLTLGAAPASAQDARPLFMIDHVELDAWAPDEHDAALRRALSMLPDRLAELPREIPDMDAEIAEVVTLLVRTAARPGRLAITYNPNNNTGLWGYGLAISAETEGREAAHTLAGHARFAIDQADGRFVLRESELVEGFTEIPTPAGSVHFGPRRDGDTWRFEILAGSVSDPAQGLDQFADVADGDYEPIVRGRIDLGSLTAAVNMAQMAAGEDGRQLVPIRHKLEQAGLLGDDAMNFDYAIGFSDEHLHGTLRAEGAKRFFEFLRFPTDTIPRAHYKAFPSDVYYATAARLDFGFIEAMLDLAAEFGAPIEDAEQELRNQTGIDLREDLLRTLGGTMAFYSSESTGGGGLLSTVLMSTFQDRDRFLKTHARMVEMANDAARQIPTPGKYVKLEAWKHDGLDLMSLRFPGLPVPFELTYAVTRDWLIFAGTPQAAIAAAMQASGRGDDGLLSNPRLGDAIPHRKGLQSFEAVDSHHTIRSGYAATQLLGSAIANLVRSPHGDARRIGLITPTFGELREGLAPIVKYSVWDGDDLTTHGTSDRSWLGTMAGQAGAFGGGGGSVMSFLPMIMQAAERGDFDGGPPLFMGKPVPGPVFAALSQAPLPYVAAGAVLYADTLGEDATSQ
ncbi:MAG: hypothetical protein AAGK04_08760 [Planctomycetota bacterium]